MKTTGLMKNLRVYWHYYWGRFRGRRMMLFGKPGSARFKCCEFRKFRLTKEEFSDYMKQRCGPEEFSKTEVVPCDCGGKDGSFFIYNGQKMDCPGWRAQYKSATDHPCSVADFEGHRFRKADEC